MFKNIFCLFIAGMIHFMPFDVLATHIRGGFIEIISDPLIMTSCKVKVYLYTDAGSTVRPGGGTIDFGDGSSQSGLQNADSSILFGNYVLLSIFSITHEFPGPGTFTINYSEFNRNGGILNINNSVNTPFYIETRIIIDPFYGSDSTPHIMNYFPTSSPLGTPYLFSIVAMDPEGDSLSYIPVIPKVGKDQEAPLFFIPSTAGNNIIYSQMFTAGYTGDIFWQQTSTEGAYVYAVRMDEWRKTTNGWINLSSTVFDFMFYIYTSDNLPADITGLKDTAFVTGNNPVIPFKLSDMNGDLIRVRVYTDLNPDYLVQSDLSDTIFYPAPKLGTISIKDSSLLKRNKPYKIVAVITENNIDQHRPFFIWFTDKPSNPTAPSGLKVDYANKNRIKISWNNDANNVAGYTIERADTYNPGYLRIAALSNNVSSFIDESILDNRDYFYKVKAIGTSCSAPSFVLKINKDDIIDALDPSPEMNEIILFPNPVNDILKIQYSGNVTWMQSIVILDIRGRINTFINVDPDYSDLPRTLDVSNLERGVYIIIIRGEGVSLAKRFIKY